MHIIKTNTKSVSLEQLPVDAWQNKLGLSDNLEVSPLLKRCVSYRADSLSMVPFVFTDTKGNLLDNPDPFDASTFQMLLKQIEKSLLKYSRAYVLISEMRLLDASTIENVWDKSYGLVGFKRRVGTDTINFELDELLYFYDCSESETSVEKSAYQCASLFLKAYNNVIEFVSAYFENGTIKSTLLYIDGMPTIEERDRLKTFWQRAMRGIKNAFSVEIIRNKIEPISIGDGLESLNISILDNITAQVLLAYSVPASLVLPSAANFATAEQDKFNFYENVVIPRALYIQSVVNKGVYNYGVQIKFNYQSMQIFQRSEADRATSLTQLVNSGFTLAEALDTLGYVVPDRMKQRLSSHDRLSEVEDSQEYVTEKLL